MKNKFLKLSSLGLVLLLVSLACQISVPRTPTAPTPTLIPLVLASDTPLPAGTATPTASPATVTPTASSTVTATPGVSATPGAAPAGLQVDKISGTYTYTNSVALETFYVEPAVALVDLHGFVIRSQSWVIPVGGQILGFLKNDPATKSGSFQVDLPEVPEGTFQDVSHRSQKDAGVQIYTAAYWPNTTGGPYAEGDDTSMGWPTYLTSVKIDTENNDEITGGKLVVWAPDDQELFPTGFGSDGKLFTPDDPVGPLPAGWSVIDLDQKPFAIERSSVENLTLYEGADLAIKDFSKLSYSQAFQQAFDVIRQDYAFNGIPGKAPNWDALYAATLPGIQAAETANDPQAYYEALVNFTLGFNDGHTGLSGGTGEADYYRARLLYGYGFAIRELDDGTSMVAYVTDPGPAQAAGIKLGATVISFNGTPIKDAISAVKPLSPFSTEVGKRYQQAQLLTRGTRGSTARVAFKNPGGSVQTVTLAAVQETDSFFATDPAGSTNPTALPVEFQMLNATTGYIRLNSNFDDLNLIMRLFQRALKTFHDNHVTGLILDLRVNAGGSPLGLAGFLTNRPITLGQLQYYSAETSQFQAEGAPTIFYPDQEQYTFQKEVLLVSQACASACELEAYGFSQVPGMVIVGMYPTSGTEAEVSRGQFKLPTGITLQVPTGRFVLPDGSLFLEGKGVQPTVKVPVTAANVLSKNDVVLQKAEAIINGQ